MAEATPSTSRRLAGIALTVVLLGGAFYLVNRPTSPPAPEPGASLPAAPEPEAAKPAETAAAPAEAPAAAAPEAAGPAAEKPAQAAAETPPAAPGFDLVRVEPDGSAAVAGTAAPGAKVTILADSAPVAETTADAAGNFVALFQVEPSAVPRALTVEAEPPGGGPAASSADVVMLLPPAPAAAGAEAPPAADGGPAPLAPVAATAPAAPPAATPAAASPAVAATAILRGDTVEVMPAEGATAADGLTLASISYSGTGEVTLAGLARAGALLRAYVDNRFAEEARAGQDGRWSMELGGVAGGIYTLRIDELGADGKVADRVETPFQRDYPHAPPPRPGAPAGAGSVAGSITVQPGNTLWTLARTRYGSGTMYTQIFTANREQIRDPDLIYPGQILSMPGDGEKAAE